MLDANFMRQLMNAFIGEAQEHTQSINQNLLELEKEPADERATWLWDEIFRNAHSLKGSSRAINLDEVGDLAHHLETLLGLLHKKEVAALPEIFDLVYQTLDAIDVLVTAAAKEETANVDVAALIAMLQAAATGEMVPSEIRIKETSTFNDDEIGSDWAKIAQLVLANDNDNDDNHNHYHNHNHQHTNAPSAASLAPTTAPIDETVRVTTSKLDALMAEVGELQVIRINARQRLVEISDLLGDLEDWERQWRQIRSPHRRLLLALDKDGHLGMAGKQGESASSLPQIPQIKRVLRFLRTNEVQLNTVRIQLSELQRKLEADNHQMRLVLLSLQEDVRRTRMHPISTIFDTFPRMVRDLARRQAKRVEFIVEGRDTEVDRSVIEQMKAPLVHLLRNALDHGLETPDERQVSGKPSTAKLTLRAAQQGNNIVIQVRDDGRGIIPASVRASALRKEILTAEESAQMNDLEALWLIFRTGFSTRTEVTDISGRGVGLDVVRDSIERMQGLIEVDSQPAQGTTFTLTLPLTVSATPALLVRANEQSFGVPITNVARIVRVTEEDIGQAEGHRAIRVDGRPVPLVPLADILGLEYSSFSSHSPTERRQWAIILGSAERRGAFLVDGLLGSQEVVIKSLPKPLLRIRHIAGATILGTGEVLTILHVPDLIRSIKRERQHHTLVTSHYAGSKQKSGKILIADDSITTRTMIKNILEIAGYQVQVAVDGQQAWRLLQRGFYDLVVSDVEMPNMTGFELTAQIRADRRLKNLPVILVTSLDSHENKARGIQVGADAYIVKDSFDKDDLLSNVQQFI